MESLEPDIQLRCVTSAACLNRWDIYWRLQELAIPCACAMGQPLTVEVKTAGAALQLWSVLQRFTASPQVAIAHLERCWQQGVMQ